MSFEYQVRLTHKDEHTQVVDVDETPLACLTALEVGIALLYADRTIVAAEVERKQHAIVAFRITRGDEPEQHIETSEGTSDFEKRALRLLELEYAAEVAV